jgi:Plasmid stabilisation system protein.
VAYEVEWAESALADLTETVESIARNSPSYAASLAVRTDQAAISLSELANRGRLVREYRDPAVRELIVSRKYRLIDRVSATRVSIIAFVHTSRDLAAFVEETTS